MEKNKNIEFVWIKPKDDKKERILKSLEGKTLEEKFKLGLWNKQPWLIDMCVKDGLEIILSNYDAYNLTDILTIYYKESIHHEYKLLRFFACYYDMEMLNYLSKFKPKPSCPKSHE